MGRPKKVKNGESDVVHIYKPRELTPKNDSQKLALESIQNNQITFLVGSPGSGKTILACYMAVKMLRAGKIERIIITRPAVESGERLGAMPGQLMDKLHDFLVPVYEELLKFCSKEELKNWQTTGQVEINGIGRLRGRNFHNCFIIVDESSNATRSQLIMVLTRLGMNSRMVFTGDPNQSDLPDYQKEGFVNIVKRLDNLEDVGIIYFNDNDIVRNVLLTKILERLK